MTEHHDFSPLDPFRDPRRTDEFVAGVLERATLELARRRRAPGVWYVMAAWARPALAAAALATIASVLALRSGSDDVPDRTGVVEALALPSLAEDWLVEERGPSTEDILLTVEGGSQWAAR